MIRLTIKGSIKNATRAAARHHIPVRNCFSGEHGDTFCDAPCSKHLAVMKWYGEKRNEAEKG